MYSSVTRKSTRGLEETRCTLTFSVDAVHTSTTILSLDVPLEFPSIGIVLVIRSPIPDSLRNERLAEDIITGLGYSDVNPVGNRLDLRAFELVLDTVRKQRIASGCLDVHDTFLGVARRLDHLDTVCANLSEECLVLGGEVLWAHDVDFVDDDEGGFAGEEGFDGVEQLALVHCQRYEMKWDG